MQQMHASMVSVVNAAEIKLNGEKNATLNETLNLNQTMPQMQSEFFLTRKTPLHSNHEIPLP